MLSGGTLFDIYEVAQHFGVCARTIRTLWGRGEFPAPLRIGRGLRWSQATLDEFSRKLEAEARVETTERAAAEPQHS